MFEAYKIGVKIGVIDATGGSILKIAAQFTKAQREASGFLKVLKSINAELGKASKGWASGAAEDFDRATAAAGRYENAARRAQTAGGPTARRIGVDASPFLLAAAASRGGGGGSPPLINPPSPNGPLLLGGPGGGGALPPGVSGITGANNPLYRAGGGRVSRGGFGWGWGGGGRGGGGGGSAAAGGGWAGRMAAGAVMFEGGEAMLGALHAPIEQASAYQQAQARFKQYGLTDEQNATAFDLSKNLGVKGTSYTDAMDYITEAQGVFRESGLAGDEALRGAKLAAPLLAKMAFATSSLDAESQAKMHTQELAALRFTEMRGGLKSPEAFNAIMNDAWKAIRSSGGNVDFEQYRQFMARGGIAAQGISNDALFGEMEPIIGELKGSTAGFAARTAYNRLTGVVRVPNQVAHMLADAGIWDASKIEWNKNGGIKRFNGNPLKQADLDLMSQSPVQFYEQVIKPMYRKMGIKDTDTNAIGRENALLFGSNGGLMYNLIDRQYAQTQASKDAQAKTKGIDAAVGDAEQTYAGNLKNFTAAWHNFQIEFGNAALPMLTRGLQILTPALSHAAKFLGEHSSIATGLVVIMGAIGGLAILAGPVIAIAGAFGAIATVVGGGLAVTLGGVAAALIAIAGAAATVYEWSQHHLVGTKAGDAIGSGVAHVMAALGNKEAQDAIDTNNKASALLNGPAYGKPESVKMVQVHATMNMDGRKVAQGATTHIVNAMTGAQTGMSSPDTSQFPMPSGYGFGN